VLKIPFDGLAYTREALCKELYLIELHAKDGSAFNAHCACIQEKHLLGVQGLAEEGITLATDEKERKFYEALSLEAREIRKQILDESFVVPKEPFGRMFLPSGLTEEEKENKKTQKKLSSCIEKAEISCCGEHTTDYSKCECNPVAVCRASIEK